MSTIIVEPHFIVATRDTGYGSLAAALAELIDNSIQADAREISIHIRENGAPTELSVAILDDGSGMDSLTLRSALQFGGTPRFNDRSGPGRFGMGLPNSSVSHARRIDVYSWRHRDGVLHSYLDIDHIVAGNLREVPTPVRSELPPWILPLAADTGTLVVWSKCDRLQARTVTALTRELQIPLARMFRYPLMRGALITVNGAPLHATDPLFLAGARKGGAEFGRPLTYQIRISTCMNSTSLVRIRFSELPIAKWHDLPASEKRRLGIVKGAGVSIIRANREIAYGWYFMGGKRKENYDDWWRCEIAFEPDLDEYFGVTHSKQGVNPISELERILSPDVEAVAHLLNSRARAEYARVRAQVQGPATKAAVEKERQLPPLKARTRLRGRIKYRLTVERLADDESFYSFRLRDGSLVVTINEDHPFFARIYRHLKASPRERFAVECLLLALARVEASASGRTQRSCYREGRRNLSNVLAAFLGG